MEYLKQSLKLTLACILVFSVIYPLLLWGIGRMIPNHSEGGPVFLNGKIVGFENIGQAFNKDKYFSSRPSTMSYDASASGASNYSYFNPAFIKLVRSRIDSIIKKNPDLKAGKIPVDLVTASGSGLDPHISYEAAVCQIPRIAKIRKMDKSMIENLVNEITEKPLLGIFSKPKVNVLKLNLALDNLDKRIYNKNE